MYNANGKVLLYTHKFLNKKKYKRNIEGDPIWPIPGNGAKLQSIEQNKNPWDGADNEWMNNEWNKNAYSIMLTNKYWRMIES